MEIWLTFLVAMSTVVSPVILSWLTNRNRAAEREADYRRQDEVAERAARVADAVAKRAAETARMLLAANERVTSSTNSTNQKLDVIHTLVNSNMTAALQSELDATTRELAMIREVMALKKANGLEPSPEAMAMANATEKKISELTINITDRSVAPS